jgi:uncharacterized protein
MALPPLKKRRTAKPLDSVLVKPAGPDCNMACDYCFYLEKAALFADAPTHRMSEPILDELVRQMLTDGSSEVAFGWQGGEPTLMGLPFFEKAVACQQKHGRGQTVGNGLQTNGLLIDQDWAGFLAGHQFMVGLSIDGPAHVHDRYRRLRGGQRSHAKVVDAAKRMLDAGVAVNALTVINDYSVRFPDEIYTFHKELGLAYMQLIPCLEPLPTNGGDTAPSAAGPEDYGRFLCRILDLWLDDFDGPLATTSIRFFDSVFHTYVGLKPPECTLLEECGAYTVVEHNGDVYACDFFVEDEWRLGNVLKGRLVDLLNSSRQTRFGRRKSSLPDACRECRWLERCRGGCPKERLHDPSQRASPHFCAAYRQFFAHADPTFRRLAARWRAEQAEKP